MPLTRRELVQTASLGAVLASLLKATPAVSAPAAGQDSKIVNLDDRVSFKQQLEHNVGPVVLMNPQRGGLQFIGRDHLSWLAVAAARRTDRMKCLQPMLGQRCERRLTRYYISENWRRKRGRIHLASCSYCNDGRGGLHSGGS